MRSLALLTFLLVIVVAQSARRRNGPPMDMFKKMMSNFIDGFIGNVKNKMKEPMMFGCFDISPDKKMMKEEMECFAIEGIGPIIRTLTKADVSSGDEIRQIILKIHKCTLKYSGKKLLNEDNTLNYDNLLKYVDEPAVGDEDDINTVKGIIRTCVNNQRSNEDAGTMAEVSGAMIKDCMLGKTIEECGTRGEDIGFHLPIMYAANSLSQEGKCTAVDVPTKVVSSWLKCMDSTKQTMKKRIEDRIANQGGSPTERFTALKNDVVGFMTACSGQKMNHFGRLMSKIKMVQEDMKDCQMVQWNCYLGKDGIDILTEDKKISLVAYRQYMNTFPGWEGLEEERTAINEALERCFANVGTDYVVEMQDLLPGGKYMKEHFTQFTTCFLPVYTKQCGLPNELTDYMMPSINKDAAEKAIMDLHDFVKEMKM